MPQRKKTVPFPALSETPFRKIISTGLLSGIAAGCLVPVSYAGTLSGELVYAGTTLSVSDSSAWSRAEDLNINGGEVNIGQGGSAERTLLNYGNLNVSSATADALAVVHDSVVNGGELMLGQNALATHTVQNGGRVTLMSDDPSAPAAAQDSIINGGEFYVLGNGLATRTQLYKGTMYVWGTAQDTNLTSGATLQVNGLARNTVLGAGSEAVVNAGLNGLTDPRQGGRMENTLINGGRLRNRYGVDADTIVNDGGRLDTGSVQDFGRADNGISERAVISDGGLQMVGNGGTSEGSVVSTGGRLVIQYDLHNNGYLDQGRVTAGTANDSQVSGLMENNGGTDNGTRILPGGVYRASGSETDKQFARSSGAVIEQGGQAQLSQNALATDWTIRGDVRLGRGSATLRNALVDGGSLWMDNGMAEGTRVAGGQMVNGSGSDSNTVVSGEGRYYLGGVDAATSDRLMVGSGTYANINSGTVTDATVSGTMFVAPNPYVPDTTSTLNGNIRIDSGGKVTLLHGIRSADADVTVRDSGGLYLASNAVTEGDWQFRLRHLTLSGGSVVFNEVGGGASQPGWSSLTLGSLSGEGLFAMNTDIADLKGDFLTVTGQADGDFGVLVADSGKSPAVGTNLPLIRTGGGDARFMLANSGGVVDAGTWQYRLTGDGRGNWALTSGALPSPPDDETPPSGDDDSSPPDDEAGSDNGEGQDLPSPPDDIHPDEGDAGEGPDTPEAPAEPDTTPAQDDPSVHPVPPAPVPRIITPSAAAVLDMASAAPQVFQTQLSAVRRHLESMRPGHDSDVWATTFGAGEDIALRQNTGYRLQTYGLALGADRQMNTGHAAVTFGGYFSASDSLVSFDRGGDGRVKGYSLGTYAGWQRQDGAYLDGVLEAGHYRHDVNARMTGGGRATGQYAVRSVGGHLQAGKRFTPGSHRPQMDITPYVALTGFVAEGSDYRLSNGLHARTGTVRSLQAEAGLSAGRTWRLSRGSMLRPWLGAALKHEFVTDNRVKVNQDGDFRNDLSGTRTEFRAGLRSQLTPRLSAYVDSRYAAGDKREASWSASAGVSYRW